MATAPTGATLREHSPVPPRALGLSLLALATPLIASVLAPDWMDQESGVLIWLAALIPPFLLTYYRGWRGASIGLAAGMATLSTAHVALVSLRVGAPDFGVLFWMVTTYIVVCVGIGVLGEILRRERRAAEAMALTDQLTGIPNRRYGSIFLDAAFASAIRGEPVSVVLLDLDRFKEVNDEVGHRAGDDVLRRFAEALTTVTRRMDLCCRWGGEEFLAILHNCPASGALVYVDRAREVFEAHDFAWGRVTFSAGVAQYVPGMGSPEILVAAADRALYRAKEDGRDCARVSESGADPDAFADAGALIASLPVDAHAHRGLPFEVTGRVPPAFRPGEEIGDETRVLPGQAELPRGSEHILVVEDDAATRRDVGSILKRLGYHVIEAPDGESALASARSLARLDLVLTDLVMPGMTGFTLAERLEEALGPSRMLYITAYVQGEVAWNGTPGAVSDFLPKPMTAVELARKVREVLDRPLPLPAGSAPGGPTSSIG